MSLNSLNLDAFWVCATTRHFTKASQKLNITQSALSQRIKNLEGELQTTLIIRDRAGLRLTSEGLELLRYCQTKAQLEDQLVGSFLKGKSHELSGVIRIGGFSSVMRSVVLPSLQSLLSSNSHLKLRLVSRELNELQVLLKSGEIDFMILDRNLEKESIETRDLGWEENVLVKKKGEKSGEVYLDHDEDDQTTRKFFNRISRDKIERHYLDDVYGIIDGVKLGLGMAVIPKHLIRKEKEITIVKTDRTLKVPLVLHFYAQPIYSKLHIAVVDALERNCPRFL